MKRYNFCVRIFFFSIFYFLFSILSFSSIFAAGRPGAFMSWGAGARHLALGGAGTAVGDADAFSPYYNSASLGFIEQKEIGTLQAVLWEETAYSYLSYVHPMLDRGAIGFDVIRLYSGGAVKTDENNRVTGDFAGQQIAVGIGYGKAVTEKLSVGLRGRVHNNTLDTVSASGVAMDVGAAYRLTPLADAGLSFANVISVIAGDTSDTMPVVAKIGGGYRVFGERLRLAMDYGATLGDGSSVGSYAVGIESRLNKYFALRLGKNREEMTGGFGLGFGGFNLDYAMATHYLGLSHRASFNFRFGRSTAELRELARKASAAAKLIESSEITSAAPEDEQRIMAFQENYQSAINMYKRGLFTIALDRFKNAGNIDPTDPDVPLYVERLNLITPIVPQNMSTDKVSELMRRGIVYFVEGHGQSSVKTLAYALSLEPDNFTMMRLLGRVEEKTGYRVDRSQPASGLTLVDKMQYEGLIAFKRKDYAETIKLCEEILLLEPDNALALKRMGSAFYALGEKDKAKKMWERSNGLVYDKNLDELIKKIK